MNSPPKVFVDSDVIISSLISQSGAAHFLINQVPLQRFFSNVQRRELEVVVARLGIEKEGLESVLKRKFVEIRLGRTNRELTKEYGKYTIDPDDVHIVTGAATAKAPFLITYNTKHFKTEKIKRDLNLITTRPAHFLQYLRSLS